MNVWYISFKNIKTKPLYTFLSIFTLALSVVLLLGVQQIRRTFEYQIENNLAGVDVVVGAKGSPLQLVLASVLHIDNPTGNIPYSEAKRLGKNPLIEKAIPIAYGDNYKGYRIVGTTKAFKTLYNAELQTGHTCENPMEVVIGYTVAQQAKLSVGDTFLSSHGLVASSTETHNEAFTVVGILKPTYKVIDRLIICNLESVWHVHAHNDHTASHKEEAHENHHKHHEAAVQKEITALLVSFRNPTGFLTFPRAINTRTNMQAVLPKFEMEKLYTYLGVGVNVIRYIAYLILVISSLTLFVSLYKMVKARAFDLALLRTYGASPFQLIKMVAYEGYTIIIIAFLLGFLFVKLIPHLLEYMHINTNKNIILRLPYQDVLQLVLVVLVISSFAILIAVYPIMKMKISKTLSHEN